MSENSIEMQEIDNSISLSSSSISIQSSPSIMLEEQKNEIISKDEILAKLLDIGYPIEKIIEILPKCESVEQGVDLLSLNLNINFKETCSICQSQYRSNLIIQIDCGDIYCRSCLAEYIKIRISESQVLSMPCPNHQCPSQIPESRIEELVSSEIYNKYIRFKKVEELNKEPFLRFCPKPDCEGYAVGSLKISKLDCNVCGYQYCFYCAEAWHEKEKCKFSEDQDMNKWAFANGVKYCPNCKRKVEKLMGCDHMTCTKCSYEWCWLCGSKYILGHYDACEVVKLTKKNPSLDYTLKLLFAPFLLPLACIIAFCVCIQRVNRGSLGGARVSYFVRKNKKASYFLAVLFGIIFTPLFFVFGPLALSIGVFVDIFKRWCCGRFCGKTFGVFMGVLLFPGFMVLFVIGAIGAHFLGILILFRKGYIAIRRCKDPGFMMPNIQYGYV